VVARLRRLRDLRLRDRRLPTILLLIVFILDLVAAGRLDLVVGDHRRLVLQLQICVSGRHAGIGPNGEL
jgi:hypothetical protein